jgi:hypothetical protein
MIIQVYKKEKNVFRDGNDGGEGPAHKSVWNIFMVRWESLSSFGWIKKNGRDRKEMGNKTRGKEREKKGRTFNLFFFFVLFLCVLR